MAKLSKKDFLDNYASHPELAGKALGQGGVSWADIKECPADFYAANTGAVPGMIYYEDTMTFAKKNIFLISQALIDFQNEYGALDIPNDDEVTYYNWLAWFAWENTMTEVMGYLEA